MIYLYLVLNEVKGIFSILTNKRLELWPKIHSVFGQFMLQYLI